MSSKTKTTATKEEATPALVPKLRFPGFQDADHWQMKLLGGLCKIRTGKKDANEGASDGLYPFFTCAENHIFSHTYSFDSEAILIAGNANVGQTRYYCGKFEAYQRTYVLTDFSGISVPFLYAVLNAKLRESLLSHVQVSAMSYIKLPMLQEYALAVPPSPAEQQKIAECLSSVDELIAALARKLDSLKTHKKGLMKQLFPREGETQPRLRFPEFQNAGEWREEKLDELLHFQDGFSFKSTDFVKSKEDATQVIRITDINNQNTNGDKVYIPSAFLETNKLGKYSVDDGDLLLSLTGAAGFNFFFWDGGPATINQRTAKVTAKKKSNRALLRLLEPLIHEKINARGEGQNNNLSKEFLSSIVLVIPEPDEQQRIADCLTSLDDLIAAQTQKLEALKTHKKGLMQQLFPSPNDN